MHTALQPLKYIEIHGDAHGTVPNVWVPGAAVHLHTDWLGICNGCSCICAHASGCTSSTASDCTSPATTDTYQLAGAQPQAKETAAASTGASGTAPAGSSAGWATWVAGDGILSGAGAAHCQWAASASHAPRCAASTAEHDADGWRATARAAAAVPACTCDAGLSGPCPHADAMWVLATRHELYVSTANGSTGNEWRIFGSIGNG